MSVYDLSEIQANYILELRLRQLTKYSRIELEKEQEELRREIAELEAILGSEALLRGLVSDELAEIAEKYGTPRRTVLLESEAVSPTVAAALAAAPGAKGKAAPLALEIADDPCWAILTASGPDRPHRQPGQPRRVRPADPARRLPVRGQDLRPRRDRRRHLPGPDAAPAGDGHAGAAADVGNPEHGRRRAGQGLHHPAEGRNAGGVRAAGRGPGDRDGAGRGQARAAGLSAEPRGLGSHRAQGQGHRGGRRARRVRRRRPRLRHAAGAAAALQRRRRPPAGPDRRRHGRHQAGRRGPGPVLRHRRPRPTPPPSS